LIRITEYYTVDYVDEILVDKREQPDSISKDFERRIEGDRAVFEKSKIALPTSTSVRGVASSRITTTYSDGTTNLTAIVGKHCNTSDSPFSGTRFGPSRGRCS